MQLNINVNLEPILLQNPHFLFSYCMVMHMEGGWSYPGFMEYGVGRETGGGVDQGS